MRKLICVLACAGFLVSCSKDSSNNSSSGTNLSASSLGEISGDTYAKPCETITRGRYVIGENQLGIYVDFYGIPNCGGTVGYTMFSTATFVLGDMSDVVPGAQNIDITATGIGIIPKTPEMVDWLNNDPNCSAAAPYSLNTPTSLAGVQCILSDKPWPTVNGSTKYSIIRRTETELQMGQSGYICLLGVCYNGVSADLRIRVLSSDILIRL